MSTFLENKIIKEEILNDNNFDQGMKGKILDFKFSVRPKKETNDTEPNPALEGEIIDAHENELEVNSYQVSSAEDGALNTCGHGSTPLGNHEKLTNNTHNEERKVHSKDNLNAQKDVLMDSKNQEKMYCPTCDYTSFDKRHILHHMLKYNKHIKIHKYINEKNVDDQGFEEKFVDFQFLVRPKEKEIDTTKSNPASLELAGEIILDAHENEFEANSHHVSSAKDGALWKTIRNAKIFICKYCDFKNCRKDNAKRHYNSHKGIKSITKKTELFVCKYCDFKTYYKGSFKSHTDKHEIPKEQYQYTCTLCEYKSISKHYMERHIKRKHTQKDKTFFCDICGHLSADLRNHERHSARHIQKRIFNCDMCYYKARCKSNLDKHKDNVHFKKGKQKLLAVCEVCGKKFLFKEDLNVHLFRVHGKDIEFETYICYTCGKKFIQKKRLACHVVIHLKNREKMFCANCDYTTCNKTHLIQHMVKHNKHIKMHKCNICSFETKRPHTLRHHVKTHLKN